MGQERQARPASGGHVAHRLPENDPARQLRPARSGLFGISLLSAVVIPIGFTFTLLDLLVLPFLPVSIRAWKVRAVRVLVAACIVWGCAQLVSNLYFGLGFHSVWVATMQPLLVAIAVLSAASLTRLDPTRVVYFAAAILIGQLLFPIFDRTSPVWLDPWKFGFGTAATLLLLLLPAVAGKVLHPLVQVGLLLGLSLLNVLLGFRSLSAILLVSSCLVFVKWRKPALGVAQVGVLVVLTVGVGVVAYSTYADQALSGRLGIEQRDKFEYQSSTSVGVVIAARPEAIVSAYVVAQSPLVGRGSNAQIGTQERAQVLAWMRDRGVNTSEGQVQRLVGAGLNSHSLALGAAVRAGLLGLVPWIVVWVWGVRALVRPSARALQAAQPALYTWSMVVLWDSLFSPWSPRINWMIAAWFVLVVAAVGSAREGHQAIPSVTRWPSTSP